jgi:AefR-like transcriptional repressor, C-terminal domain
MAAETLRGTFKIEDPEEASGRLFFSAAGELLLGLLLRTRSTPSTEDVAARVKQTVETFFWQVKGV